MVVVFPIVRPGDMIPLPATVTHVTHQRITTVAIGHSSSTYAEYTCKRENTSVSKREIECQCQPVPGHSVRSKKIMYVIISSNTDCDCGCDTDCDSDCDTGCDTGCATDCE